MQVRPAQARDSDAIWDIIGPTIRAGETYALPGDMSRAAALSYWNSPGHEVFVAEQDGKILGTYYMRPAAVLIGPHVIGAQNLAVLLGDEDFMAG